MAEAGATLAWRRSTTSSTRRPAAWRTLRRSSTAHALLGHAAQGETSTSQLEVVTPVCGSLADVRAEVVRLRRGAVQAAAEHGCAVLAAGTHPSATWRDQRLSEGERHVDLHRRWGLLAVQQLIAGCHVHVSVPDELALGALDRLRPELPVLLALGGSSPFWEGANTGYASYRTVGGAPGAGGRAARPAGR